MGCLELSFAAFGLIIKTGFRVNATAISPLLKGLCDAKRMGEAMEILSRRMPEFGCMPDVVSYNTVINGFFRDDHVDKAYSLFHEMDNREIFPTVVTCTQ